MDGGLASDIMFGFSSLCGGRMDAGLASGVTIGFGLPCSGLMNAGLASGITVGFDSLCGGELREDASSASECTGLFCGKCAGGGEDGTSATFRRMGDGIFEAGGTADRVWGFVAAIGSIT